MSQRNTSLNASTLGGAGFMLLGATLIQWTAALVIPAFLVLGPFAASAWRFLIGAVSLLALTRPNVRNWSRREWLGALGLGVTVAVMNQCFYQAIDHIPLGSAVVLEYLGPFCVAAFGKRSTRHLVFVFLALAGVIILSKPGNGLNVPGVLFALSAGLGWATYIFASKRVGKVTEGFGGLAVSMSIAALLTLPFSISSSNEMIHHPALLGRMAIVAGMAIVLGFGSELQGLRRLAPAIAGVMLAGDPAVAFIIGWILLNQHITLFDFAGMACVIAAGIGVTYDTSVGENDLVQ